MGGSDDTDFRVRSAYQRSSAAGEVVFEEGDPGDRLYVVQSGQVELIREGSGGPRRAGLAGPGDFFGELEVVLGRPRACRAVVVRDAALLEIDRETVESMCFEQPEIAVRMLRSLGARLIEAESRLAALGENDLLRPVVRALVRRAEPDPERGMRVPIDLRGLSEGAGLSMLETHRALQPLFTRRLLRLVDDRLIVPDLEALSACLDAPD